MFRITSMVNLSELHHLAKRHYQDILTQLGVQISRSKSIVSDNGSCEFGKRFWTDKLQKDLSPISLKALTGCRSLRGLAVLREKYKIEKISVLQRLAGAGYRVRSRLMTTQSLKWERLKVVVSKPIGSKSLPLEFWIERITSSNPYFRAKIVHLFRRELKPKELRIYPPDLVFDGEQEILERTVLSGWMKQWLKLDGYYRFTLLALSLKFPIVKVSLCKTDFLLHA